MNLRSYHLVGLYCFYWVARLGSFKEAAEQMNITAAAMSQQIRQLEERLEVSLFHRLHRSIELTHEGLLLQPIAQQAFELLNRAIDQVGTDPEPKSLAISVLPSFGQTWLVSRLGEFNQQNRGLIGVFNGQRQLGGF